MAEPAVALVLSATPEDQTPTAFKEMARVLAPESEVQAQTPPAAPELLAPAEVAAASASSEMLVAATVRVYEAQAVVLVAEWRGLDLPLPLALA
jgi:hypothetical protein